MCVSLAFAIAGRVELDRIAQDKANIARFNPANQATSVLMAEQHQLANDEQAFDIFRDSLVVSLVLDGLTGAALFVQAITPPGDELHHY